MNGEAMQPAESPSPIDALRADVNRMLETIHPENPIAATVVFEVSPASEEQFARNGLALTAATRRLPGCNVFSFHKAIKQTHPSALEYLIYEDWQSRRQFQRQWNSDHLQAFQRTVGALITAAPDLRFYTGWRQAEGRRDATPDPANPLLMPLQLAIGGMRQVARFLQPIERNEPARTIVVRPPSHGSAPAAVPASMPGGHWGPIPYPIPVPGDAHADAAANESIDDALRYESHFQEVPGARMHYLDEGRGDPILLLHGNPTWSYIWRNIIPELTPIGRCIAPDLVGFGRSSKPEIEYRWFEQLHYLEKFIDRLDLRNITLVLHDHGSGLGFHYAMRHPANVKAIAFFEALVRPFDWDQFSTPPFRDLFRRFRSGGVHGEGWQLIVDQNVFIEELLPQAAGRPLSATAMRYYREPFRDRASRIPIWQFARATAIGGEPRDVWAAVSDYSARLQRSDIPKLLLYAEPGALLTAEHVDWCRRSLPALETVSVGAGIHFLQESSPRRIGREIANWLGRLQSAQRPASGAGR